MSNPQIPGPDIGQILMQAQRMQAELMTAQQELADTRVDGTAGGGLVKATVTGGGELVDLTISPAAVDPTDTETLADLVLAAVRDAAVNARGLAAERMGEVTGGLGDALGGFGVPGGLGVPSGPSGLAGGSGSGPQAPGLG
ncbi:YbaB/EbfC family nucleoid-associated protein [Frankia sp. Cr1]|uniref:YbaB/EbfC family nucleoid-associated protein n=1 Tax=Frankia sp. Cr1 TaxID=3073931 RepID=UPI002AD56416|nr:YbaB/EbfC family nucleoid-associated protein [Frankia sp. Cr1]